MVGMHYQFVKSTKILSKTGIKALQNQNDNLSMQMIYNLIRTDTKIATENTSIELEFHGNLNRQSISMIILNIINVKYLK